MSELSLCTENSIIPVIVDSNLTSFNQSNIMRDLVLREEPKNVQALQINLFSEFEEVLQKFDKDGKNIQEIKQYLRKTTSFQDVLQNICLLMPELKDLKETFEHKQKFVEMEKSCKILKLVLIKLDKLISQAKDLMIKSRKDLDNLITLVKSKKDNTVNLKQIIDEQIKEKLNNDVETVKTYQKELEKILESIETIRQNEQIVDLEEITKGMLNFNFQSMQNTTTSSVISKAKTEIEDQNRLIAGQLNEILQFENSISEINTLIKKEENNIKQLEKQTAQEKSKLREIHELIKEDKKTKSSINVEQLKAKYIEEFTSKRLDTIHESESQFQKQYNNMTQLKVELQVKRIQQMNKLKQFHIIIFFDDSGSMHVKSKKQKGKSSFELASESINQFIIERKSMGNCIDLISILKFSSTAIPIHQREDINTITLNLDIKPQKQSTNFDSVFELGSQIQQLNENSENTIIILLTDGQSDTSSKCEQYLKQMIQKDSGLKMFALGVGDDIDELFLKNLCKFANRNVEIMNKGYSQPINYYQKVENPTQLMKIFQDISKGLKESHNIIIDEINFLEKQIGNNQELFDKFKSERKRLMDEEEEEKNKKMEDLDNLLNKTKRSTILENEKKTIEEKISNNIKYKLEIELKIQKFKDEIDQNEKAKESNIKERQENITKAKNKIKEWERDIDNEIQDNEVFKRKKLGYLKEIGCKNEASVEIWNVSIKQFGYFLNILLQSVRGFNRFFNKLANIQSSIPQLSQADASNPLSIDAQVRIICQFYNKQEENEQKSQGQLEQIINQIVKENYYINRQSSEDQQTVEQVISFILEQTRSLQTFIENLPCNKQQDPDSKKQKKGPEKQKLPPSFTLKQKQETEELNDKLKESSRKLTNIGVFNILRIKKMKNADDLEDILLRIEEFDFENLDENDTDDFEIGSESDEDKNEKEKDEQDPVKNEKSPNEKTSSKKQKKYKPIDSSEVDSIKEKIEKIAKQKFKLGQKHLNQKEQFKKVQQSIEQTLTSVIQNASKEYKDHQISQLESFIKEVLIKQIDELLHFN